MKTTVTILSDKLTTERAKTYELRLALIRYGEHDQGCPRRETNRDYALCTCGLDELLDEFA